MTQADNLGLKLQEQQDISILIFECSCMIYIGVYFRGNGKCNTYTQRAH